MLLTPGPAAALREALTPNPSPALREALTPSPAAALRAALTPSPAPALRVALTPNPSPALRERGDLVRELGIVKGAGAPLLRSTPPFSPRMRAEGS